ncbi:hypothetical protein NKH77_19595 [Streptomyces sp. M19]
MLVIGMVTTVAALPVLTAPAAMSTACAVLDRRVRYEERATAGHYLTRFRAGCAGAICWRAAPCSRARCCWRSTPSWRARAAGCERFPARAVRRRRARHRRGAPRVCAARIGRQLESGRPGGGVRDPPQAAGSGYC